MEDQRPLPILTRENGPYWKAAAEGRLVMPLCKECDEVFYPVAPVCPACVSDRLGWRQVSGRGTVSSWIVYHQAFFPFFKNRLPYAVVQVELDEGPRMSANLFGADPADIRIGMRVETTFERVNDDVTLPQFRPAA